MLYANEEKASRYGFTTFKPIHARIHAGATMRICCNRIHRLLNNSNIIQESMPDLTRRIYTLRDPLKSSTIDTRWCNLICMTWLNCHVILSSCMGVLINIQRPTDLSLQPSNHRQPDANALRTGLLNKPPYIATKLSTFTRRAGIELEYLCVHMAHRFTF